jgi:RNA polymerase sigma-70 factor (ECF subfamily)
VTLNTHLPATGAAAPVAEDDASDVVPVREARFDECFRQHYARVLAYALRRLPDRSGAEDVAAETFLVAWRRLDDIPSDALPWLLGIARHVIQNERRSARRRDRLAARIGAQPLRHEPAAGDASPSQSEVRQALGRLSERDREVLLLTTWDGLDHRRAAAVLGCSRGTFAVRLHRARIRLARELNDGATPTNRETT